MVVGLLVRIAALVGVSMVVGATIGSAVDGWQWVNGKKESESIPEVKVIPVNGGEA